MLKSRNLNSVNKKSLPKGLLAQDIEDSREEVKNWIDFLLYLHWECDKNKKIH